MRNKVIKTFEEFVQKIEIEDSDVHFHFGSDEGHPTKTNHQPGDEVMVDLPLVKLNKAGDIEGSEPQEIENLENPSFDMEDDSDYEGSDDEDDDEDNEEDNEDE